MNRRQFAVLGLGKFGRSVARTLSDAGYEVIAVDHDEEKVNFIAKSIVILFMKKFISVLPTV